MNIYCISGLGADEKAFSRIDFSGHNIYHIKWTEYDKNDTLTDYVLKLIPQFDLNTPFIVIGLSFGGIIAQELANQIKPNKIILISTVEHQKHFPWFYKVGKVFIPMLPNSLFTKTNRLINYMFGAKGKNITVLDNIMQSNDPQFVKWCVNVLLKWKKNQAINVPLISIHGTNDKIIPYRKCDYSIKNGSHFMIYSKAEEIQKILQKEISLSS